MQNKKQSHSAKYDLIINLQPRNMFKAWNEHEFVLYKILTISWL